MPENSQLSNPDAPAIAEALGDVSSKDHASIVPPEVFKHLGRSHDEDTQPLSENAVPFHLTQQNNTQEQLDQEQKRLESLREKINDTLPKQSEHNRLKTPLNEEKDSLPSNETLQGLATREYVKDEAGNIIDVKFSQNGQIISLRELSGIDFTLDFHPHENLQGMADPSTKTLSMRKEIRTKAGKTIPMPEKDFNALLFHELGHLQHLFPINQAPIKRMQRRTLDQTIRKDMLYSFNSMLTNDEATKREHHISEETRLYHFANKVKSLARTFEIPLTPEELQQFQDEALATYHHVRDSIKTGDGKRIKVEIIEAGKQLKRIDAEYKLEIERPAWVFALTNIRELRRRGVNVFNGTNDELLQQVNGSLGIYEISYGKFLEGNRHFVRVQPQEAPEKMSMGNKLSKAWRNWFGQAKQNNQSKDQKQIA